jgi:hypothetical protein
MKQDHFLLALGCAVLAVTLAGALLAGGCASVAPVNVPETLQPAANESLAMTVAARGVQIYECRPAKGGATHEWVFIAPEAQLFNDSGRAIGRHGAGPFWQASDGSRVVGSLKARADAPVSGAIPWLLLATKSTATRGRVQQHHQHPARQHRRRAGSGHVVLAWPVGARPLHGGLPAVRRPLITQH